MKVIKTGIIAKPEDVEHCFEWHREMSATPVMKLGRHWLHEEAQREFERRIDELAVSYGLPEPAVIDGEVWHYGILRTGEFTRAEPDAVEE